MAASSPPAAGENSNGTKKKTPMAAPSPPGNGNGNNNKARLSDQQKKQNHIVSEQKRREAIRKGFDRLAEIVPGMEGQGRSEATVLQATVEHLRQLMEKKEQLRRIARERGMSDQEFEAAYTGAQKTAQDGEDNAGEGSSAGKGSSGDT